ncbi:blue copper protein 1a-like [Lotus japonicus]|uniref:blue copper protein 1a-like n=1 Tax=Lotus japonicus TaxID=34305 RepID=UPI002588D892|nr:blue copper protein 1a-like [Lotus japonicus]
MGSARIAFFAMSMILVSSVAMATDHIVGDDKGWTVNFNYTQWAQDKVFRVGDNLVFNYDNAKHNVFKVSGASFKDCTIPPANEALTTGKDVIPLTTEGRKWYICGKADHCIARQMKFVINVEAQAAPAPSAAHSMVSSVLGVIMSAMVVITAFFA